jgi:Tol biopolymer transport system component
MSCRGTSRVALVLVLGLVAACSSSPDTKQRNPSPALEPTAATVRFLTSDTAATDYWPCFSPDGQVVLFSRSLDHGKTWALFAVPVSGGAAHPLVGSSLPASATRSNWSGHSGGIAFTAEEPSERATVWIISGEGGQAKQITAAGLSDSAWYPSWYPDDTHLAVVDYRGVVMRVDLGRRTTTALTDTATILAGMPSVSPDGKRIAFAGQLNRGQEYDQTQNTIWLLEEGGKPRNIVPGQGRTPAWSPDGEWLAFESNRGSSSSGLYAAFVVRRDGSGLRQVTNHELDANHPVWSRDGKFLVFSARHTRNLAATGIAIAPIRGQ